MESQYILSNEQARQKTQRIAFEIFENHTTDATIVLAGVYDKGYFWAKSIQKELAFFFSGKIHLLKLVVDKNLPTQAEISIDCDLQTLENKPIILIDDVLNSGRTLAYCLKPFLNIPVKSIEIAVLIDRGHKKFPVAPDYVGYALSTTLKEHVEVVFENEMVQGALLH